MSLSESGATPPPPQHNFRRGDHPTGREFEWNGSAGWLQTEPLAERPKTWDEFIRDAGLDPEEVEVIEPVQVRGWDMPKREEDGTTSLVRAHYYRLSLHRRGLVANIDDLVKAARRRTTKPSAVGDLSAAFVIALGDLQLGKMDGDGVEGTVERFLTKTQAAIARYKRVAKGRPIYLIHLGDCIEGYMSQGGANTWRTTLTTTEQVRLYRRLLLEQIKALAPICPELVMVGVPGNHDEAHRPLQTYGDSWAIDAVSAVSDALQLAGGYDHVRMIAPPRDDLTVTLDVCGTIVGMAHGHQFGSGVEGWKKWWQGQGHGRQAIGDADLLLAGHKHHLCVVQQGPRTFVQAPALESESTWWKLRTGEGGNPGIVTMMVGGGGWSSIEVL